MDAEELFSKEIIEWAGDNPVIVLATGTVSAVPHPLLLRVRIDTQTFRRVDCGPEGSVATLIFRTHLDLRDLDATLYAI